MLSFVVQNRRLQAASKPLPTLRRGWALIRVRRAGICNTDVEILRGYHEFHGTPGHEFVGEVAEVEGVNAATRKKWLGNRVAGEINVTCSAYGYRPLCDFCRRGLKTHCARRTVLGIVAQDGAFGEYLALPLENLRETVIGVNKDSAHRNLPLFGYSGRNAGKCKHGVHQDIGAGRAIRLGCVLELVVADAVLAGHEHHRRLAGEDLALGADDVDVDRVGHRRPQVIVLAFSTASSIVPTM